MSAFVIFGVLAALLLMEYLSVGARAEKLLFHCSADRELTEPGGVVTVTACVTNSSALPRLFVRVWMFFGEGVALREDTGPPPRPAQGRRRRGARKARAGSRAAPSQKVIIAEFCSGIVRLYTKCGVWR